MKKLGIFLFNNQCGPEAHVKYILDDITSNLKQFCVIIKGNSNLKEYFKDYTNDIYINNTDYEDIRIWKDVLINQIGFKQLINFDEVILFDDSFFGPIYSFKEIFNNTDNINLDLWTILSNGLDDELNSSNFQFIAFRNNLIKSNEFRDFWENLEISDFNDKNNENYLINYFSKLGFKWKNYLDVVNNTELNMMNPFFSIFDINNLIINYKMPLINIKPFTLSKKIHLKYHNGLDLSRTMNYLNLKTNYDVSLIYSYLLKVMDPNRIVNQLNLKKIISTENFQDYKSNKSIVVIAHLYYDDLLDYDFKFLSNIPEYIDIVITTDEMDKKSIIEEKFLSKLKNRSEVILVNSRGRDMSGLFVGCKDIIKNYDYFCFMHDKKSAYNSYYLIGYTFRDILWENMLYNENYINSIIKSFDENDSLGLIVPPRVYYSSIFTVFYKNYWLKNIDGINRLFDEMGIDCELDLNESPLPIGNCFWAKVDALKPLFDLDLNYEDFHHEPLPLDGTISHALERIYGHVAANKGYYTEIVMTDEYGSIELTNYPYMLTELLGIIRHSFDKMVTSNIAFNEFLIKFKKRLYNLDAMILKNDKKLNEVTNSRSWKITKPLRMVSFKFKNLKNKLVK